ncbi:MAG TPA: FecR family protein, partial [Kofleriaceae bacterium]|nr:FecR family protein [Kofleriaceae bacterium]
MSRMRPDVPPLSDLSRQRIRQAVFDRLDREPAAPVAAPRRRPVLLAAGAAAAVVAAVVAVSALGGDRARPAAPRHPAVSRLETGGSPSQVTVGDARITAGPNAALTATETGDGGVQVFLERGSIDLVVAPRGDRPPFVVLAADVRVEVVGTRFTVARDGDAVSVSVAEGVVRVTRPGSEDARVAAGERWPAAAPEPPDDPEMTFEPEAASSPRPKRRKPPPVEAPEAAPSARERYEAAAAAEQSRPEEALAAYRALVAEGGAWADNALFAQASLELKLGRRAAARRSLVAYLERYPRGAN